MNFENLKSSWQTQPLKSNMNITAFKSEFDSRWNQHQRKVYQTNVCMTLGFIGALIAIAWVYFSFKDEYGLPFKISLLAMYVLMIVFAVISWRSYGFSRENLEATNREFINRQLDKIKWQRKVITHYFWIYMALIWLALVMYLWEIMAPGTALMRYSALGICSFFLLFVSVREARKQKKRLARLDEMKAELDSNFY